MKKITLLFTLLVSFSGFAQFPLPYCAQTFTSNVEPITLVNFAGINNTTSALVGLDNGTTIIALEDYTATIGNVTAGSSYPITLKGNTDGGFTTYLRVYVDWNQNNDFTDVGESYDIGRIVNSTGVDAVQLVGSILVPPSALTGNTRMRVVKRYNAYGISCQTGAGFGQAEDYTLTVAALPPDLPDYANLQFPSSATISQGGNVTVYGQVYEGGLTDTTIGQALGINAWVGISPIGSDTNPNTWTNWIPATFNVEVGNNDEYQASIGASLVPGTYYYATRFQLNGGAFVYGGTNNGFWDGTTKLSGVLTVNAPTPPANDDCTNAITLTCGSNLPNQTTLAATGASATTCIGTIGNDIWYKFVGTGESINVTANATADFPQVEVFQSTDGTCAGFSTGAGACFASGGTGSASVTVAFISTLGTTYFIRVGSYINTNPPTTFTLTLNCISPPDFVNLQSPSSATITQGGSVTVYGQIYEAGLTNPAGQAAGILAWVGVSPIGSNTNPNTWTSWTPASYNVDFGNNDEYQAAIGATLAPGTYYYATRFQLNGGGFYYGGIDASNNGNFWDGTTYLSGVLTVNPAPAPANDDCASAIVLTPGGVFIDNVIDTTNLGATLSSELPNPTTCGALNFATVGKDVWYSVVVPASGSITIETAAPVTGTIDTVITVYSGTCSTTLVQVGCNDDIATGTNNYSRISLTGQIAGDVLLARVFGYNGAQGRFKISAYDGSLGNSSFDNANFTFYPNPVKNILNLSYNQEISVVEVFNLLGQKVSSNKINANAAQVDMSNLSKGAYMVRVTSNNQVKTIKVIKE